MTDPDFEYEQQRRNEESRKGDRLAVTVGLCGIGFIAMLSAIILSYL